ncbi:HLA class II histocompatibility antigen, DP beta 1 chain-like isoform X1 [Pelodiscus sinensis]|uniref:HLA class II histocompatibility antigen, DP beta 1 chain-like isoform X1 n=1 Tax=Pelodiscus sinensis TaxID=13735 RepID=UPI003F6B5B56
MAPARPALLAACLLWLCAGLSAGAQRFTHSQLIVPAAAPGLPKRQSLLRVNGLALSAYDSSSRQMRPRSGYAQPDPESLQFWSVSSARCMFWDPWVEGEYQALVRAVNASAPRAEPYFLQVVQSCEQDAAGEVRALSRYALNGEDALQYRGERDRWFALHPAAWPLAERWNRQRDALAGINAHTPEQCATFLRLTAPFAARTAAQPTGRVSLVRGARLLCHVTGFYPPDIEVGWERGGRAARGRQRSSGVQPNGDPTFQIRVSVELGWGARDPAGHECVVRHRSLGGAPLRLRWEPPPPGLGRSLGISAACVLAGLGAAALGWYLRRGAGRLRWPCRPAWTKPAASRSVPPGDPSAPAPESLGVPA